MSRFETRLRTVALWDEAWCVRLNRASGVRWLRLLRWAASRFGDGVLAQASASSITRRQPDLGVTWAAHGHEVGAARDDRVPAAAVSAERRLCEVPNSATWRAEGGDPS